MSSLAAIVADVADAIVVVGEDSVVKYANAAVETMFGHDPDALIGRPYDVLIPERVVDLHTRHHAAFLADPVARPMGRGLLLSARHADGYDFDVTIALVPVRHDPPLVAAIVREATTSQRVIARMSATTELLTAALAGAPRHEVEQRSVELVRHLVDAQSAWLVTTPDDETETTHRVIASAGGVAPEWLATSGSRGSPTPQLVISCPIARPGAPLEVVAERDAGSRGFDDLDQQVICEFAGAFAITTELIDARSEVDRLKSIADHDRIARDLHDRVIQRLFVIAMRLESVASGVSGLAQERIGEAVESLDEVIREIRTTIFDLRRSAGPQGLRAAVAAEIDEIALSLGFAPSLRFVGSMDDIVEQAIADEAPTVVRELLSNARQHSGAGTIDVSVYTDESVLRIVVEDDGVGLASAVEKVGGLSNLGARANALGGEFVIASREPSGTRADWSVPLSGSDG